DHDRTVEREHPEPVDEMQSAVADAGRSRADQHLAPPWLVDLHRFDRQRLLNSAKDGSLDLQTFLPLYPVAPRKLGPRGPGCGPVALDSRSRGNDQSLMIFRASYGLRPSIGGGALRLPLIASSRRIDRLR